MLEILTCTVIIVAVAVPSVLLCWLMFSLLLLLLLLGGGSSIAAAYSVRSRLPELLDNHLIGVLCLAFLPHATELAWGSSQGGLLLLLLLLLLGVPNGAALPESVSDRTSESLDRSWCTYCLCA